MKKREFTTLTIALHPTLPNKNPEEEEEEKKKKKLEKKDIRERISIERKMGHRNKEKKNRKKKENRKTFPRKSHISRPKDCSQITGDKRQSSTSSRLSYFRYRYGNTSSSE
ncbi:hypothetical protein CEXT_401191 [Caerostris extrusa]|uniref:Uncharacterized protein n=1 Tax=Caerostris extrusa TaxID=172846 RepID=A0AAV4PZ56_CAEEX|nr:hypothetical protein CEXT_401191 [Caerostris extrusa]